MDLCESSGKNIGAQEPLIYVVLAETRVGILVPSCQVCTAWLTNSIRWIANKGPCAADVTKAGRVHSSCTSRLETPLKHRDNGFRIRTCWWYVHFAFWGSLFGALEGGGRTRASAMASRRANLEQMRRATTTTTRRNHTRGIHEPVKHTWKNRWN